MLDISRNVGPSSDLQPFLYIYICRTHIRHCPSKFHHHSVACMCVVIFDTCNRRRPIQACNGTIHIHKRHYLRHRKAHHRHDHTRNCRIHNICRIWFLRGCYVFHIRIHRTRTVRGRYNRSRLCYLGDNHDHDQLHCESPSCFRKKKLRNFRSWHRKYAKPTEYLRWTFTFLSEVGIVTLAVAAFVCSMTIAFWRWTFVQWMWRMFTTTIAQHLQVNDQALVDADWINLERL